MSWATAGGTTTAVKEWYEANAQHFEQVLAVEGGFLGLSPAEQVRLNQFKLWAVARGGLVSLEGKRVLDFGCGHGRLAMELRGYTSYVGVDISSNLVRIGRRRLTEAGLSDRAQLVAADCLAFKGPREWFDVVCSLGMFSFVEQPRAVLQKMVDHLRPGGLLFIDVHYASPLYAAIRRSRWERQRRKGGAPRRAFTEREVQALLTEAGLSNVRCLMREYPFLGPLYARTGWHAVLGLRNQLARRRVFNVLGTDFFAFGRKPMPEATARG